MAANCSYTAGISSCSLEMGEGVRRAGHHVLALGVDQVLAEQGLLAGGGGCGVKATPVPELSPELPNTMDWTLTAVPQS